MVEFKIKVNRERTAYIPKEIFAVLGSDLTAIANRCAVILYSEGTAAEDVLRSLQIISDDLKHAQKLKQKEASSRDSRN